jgi:hypothetical protein
MNFENKQDRKLIMVLPQFIGGIFFTMIYVSNGFFAALFAHVICDMVLFCSDYCIPFRLSRLVLSLYHLCFLAVCSLVFFILLDHPITDVLSVLSDQTTHWSFIDYFVVVGVWTSASALLLEVLWYDLEKPKSLEEFFYNWFYISLSLVVAYIVLWKLQPVFTGNLVIVISLAVCIIGIDKTTSGSGVARLFWKSFLLSGMLLLVQKANSGVAICLFLPFLLHQYGERIIRANFAFHVRYSLFLEYIWRVTCHRAVFEESLWGKICDVSRRARDFIRMIWIIIVTSPDQWDNGNLFRKKEK